MSNKARPYVVALVALVTAAAGLALWRFLPATAAGKPNPYRRGVRTAHERDLATTADKIVAASTLGNRSEPGSAPRLLHLLRDPNPNVRAAAAAALKEMADPKTAADLLRQLEHESDPLAGAAIIRAVDALNLPEAAPALLKRIDDPSPMVRLAAVGAVGRYCNSNAIAGLARATSDTNNSVRANASDRLAAIGAPAIPAMLEVMGAGGDLARIYRIAALGRIRSDGTVPALVNVLRAHEPNVVADRYPSTDTPVRVSVLDALADIGEPAAVILARDEIGKNGDLALKSVAADLFLRIRSPAGVRAVTDRLLGWKTMVSEPEWKLWTDMLTAMDTPESKESLAKLQKHRNERMTQ